MYKYPRTPHIEGSRLQPGDEDLDSVPFSAIASQFGSGYSGCNAMGYLHPLTKRKTVFLFAYSPSRHTLDIADGKGATV
jgi:hypothetical protein